ncbi:MAG: tetratricopeptide repeat protein, partial [Deltaproteobacteria bacterium]|nr:tetratricopeptide repeat protein [Deltaproteobacteria bacterium]
MVWLGVLWSKKRFGSIRTIVWGMALCIGLIFVSAYILEDKKQLDGSAWYRLTVWQNCIEMIKDRPVLGLGPGGFQFFYPAYTNRVQRDPAFDKEKQIRRVHNDFLQLGAELGIPGALLFTGLLFGGLYMAWKLGPDKKHGDQTRLLSTWLSTGIVAFMGTAAFSFPLQRSTPPLILFVYLGLLARMYYEHRYKTCRKGPVTVGRAAAIVILCVVLVGGGALVRFNWRNVLCDSHFRTAMRMEKKRHNPAALAAGLRAHEYNRHRMDVLSTVGRAYVTTKQYDKAIIVLEKVVRGYPYHLNALFILGVAYTNSDNNDQALETFRRVLQIKPNFKEAKQIVSMIKSRGKARVNLS